MLAICVEVCGPHPAREEHQGELTAKPGEAASTPEKSAARIPALSN